MKQRVTAENYIRRYKAHVEMCAWRYRGITFRAEMQDIEEAVHPKFTRFSPAFRTYAIAGVLHDA